MYQDGRCRAGAAQPPKGKKERGAKNLSAARASEREKDRGTEESDIPGRSQGRKCRAGYRKERTADQGRTKTRVRGE